MNKQVMTKTFDQLESSFNCNRDMAKVLYDECERLSNALIEERVKLKNILYDIANCTLGETENSCEKFIYLDDINSVLYENDYDTISTSSEG